MQNWIVLIPPVLVLVLAVITQRVLSSLLIGILASALIVTRFSIPKTILFLFERFWEQLYDAANLYTFTFLILLGMLIALMNSAGGTTAYGKIIQKILRNARSTKFSSIILSMLFMIDDFFSCLTVGCIMQPLTDSFKIPRVKLAFLIDSLAAPLVVIMPISTWVAMLLMQLDKAGISLNPAEQPIFSADPFITYLQIIPFVFYSFLIFVSAWFIVHKNISFGRMRNHELIAQQTGNLFGGKKPTKSETQEACPQNGSVWDFILPLGSLMLFSLLTFIWTRDTFFAFFLGSFLALSINVTQMLLRKKIISSDLKKIALEGTSLMIGSLKILFLAWVFSSILKDDLKTGQYIAHLLIGAVPGWLLPAMFFIASLFTSIATGSSWGTIAVMVPLAVPMLATFAGVVTPALVAQVPLLLPVLGSIFAGAVAGDHVSPIGTTTIMSATSSGAYLQDHVWTQLPYAMPAIIGAIIAYLLSGFLINSLSFWPLITVCIGTGILVSLMGLLLLNRLAKK